MSGPGLVLVARIGKPHGLRGEVTVEARTDDPHGRFAPGAVLVTVAEPGTGVPHTLSVRSARVHGGKWLLAFEEIPDRTGAESLRGTLLHVQPGPGDDAVADEGWYEHDLVGLTAYDPGGAPIGQVSALTVGAAQDLLTIRLADGRQALVPFVTAIVPQVDVAGGRVVVDAPPGLFDLAE